MSISKGILGLNARNFLYIRKYNLPSPKQRADNKLETKKLLIRNKIPTNKLLQVFDNRESIKNFDWSLPEEGFALKPARGYGGEGILIFKNWNNQKGETISGETFDVRQIESHILDIFEGAYSLQSLPDKAYIEEKITPQHFLKKIDLMGLPDIRIIVFNKVPVMAMLRLPTPESKGKANLHLGAVGVGIDLRTGITKDAVYRGTLITFIPNTKIKTRGIKIPFWDQILMLASKAQFVSRLGLAGVDIVIDENIGPLILEINSRPGLSIQNANLASLRSRLERVEHINIPSFERAIEVSRSLFADDFSDKVDLDPKVLSIIEPIVVINEGKSKMYEAKLDTGAFRTSLDKDVVQELNLEYQKEKILIKAASGQQERRVVKLTFNLAGKKITTNATVAERGHLKYPIIVGRRDLKGFLINPDLPEEKSGEAIEDIEISTE
ncbi:ATP-dependent zinc protease [Candidatus Daviesbacteria bacterium]|nr:ATP-dependent zinc protease [Candidatus Daviesbacteria bacterium]